MRRPILANNKVASNAKRPFWGRICCERRSQYALKGRFIFVSYSIKKPRHRSAPWLKDTGITVNSQQANTEKVQYDQYVQQVETWNALLSVRFTYSGSVQQEMRRVKKIFYSLRSSQ